MLSVSLLMHPLPLEETKEKGNHYYRMTTTGQRSIVTVAVVLVALSAADSCFSSSWTATAAAFVVTHPISSRRRHRSFSFSTTTPRSSSPLSHRFHRQRRRVRQTLFLAGSYYDDEEDDDEYLIDPDSLGDWRAFRRNLAAQEEEGETAQEKKNEDVEKRTVCEENEQVLRTQNRELAAEYKTGVWAHNTATPEVGGLIVRMPLEAELYRSHRHSMTGRKLRKKLRMDGNDGDNKAAAEPEPAIWYSIAQKLVEDEMTALAGKAGDDGQIDASALGEESAEALSLYLDHQETWQEVCLVVEKNERSGKAKAVVLNRPMALKLTANLAQLILYGTYHVNKNKGSDLVTRPPPAGNILLKDFMKAFGHECGVYVGGPDDQHLPAMLVHGIADLPGAAEISKGCGIYEGGLQAAVRGVLEGRYRPLDFRFFVGRHSYAESKLDVQVLLGKYQPVACARTLALKQCISLPKPLWHEVCELCGGEMRVISQLELLKRDDLLIQIVDEDEDEEFLSGDDVIPDELDEMEALDDEDDEGFYGL